MLKHSFLVLLFILTSKAAFSQKKVAITLDDLPVAGGNYSLEETKEINRKIVSHLEELNAPTTGFVNEKGLNRKGELDERIDILRMWAESDILELGNHTFSHPFFHSTGLEDYKAEVMKGEVLTRPLLEEYGKEMSYFRFPFNDTGADTVKKEAFEKYLTQMGYTIAPVTVQSSDYIYNALYVKAKEAGDKGKMKKIADGYLALTDTLFAFFEKVSEETVGRPIAHVFLAHVNQLHADILPQLITLIRDRGYEIVPLQEAMQDPVYQKKDPYVKHWGISWLHRWNTEDRMKYLGTEPEVQSEFYTEYETLTK
ncbi:polysaccharide deacetylase family protein [Roseivirga sp. BDSF3-8]|uniref:polysaccharide deacetylase family protein n=1 Tax=Roseivirga sp. BDSF3-8 TaxID=3241598 RepID=UPI0035325C71